MLMRISMRQSMITVIASITYLDMSIEQILFQLNLIKEI